MAVQQQSQGTPLHFNSQSGFQFGINEGMNAQQLRGVVSGKNIGDSFSLFIAMDGKQAQAVTYEIANMEGKLFTRLSPIGIKLGADPTALETLTKTLVEFMNQAPTDTEIMKGRAASNASTKGMRGSSEHLMAFNQPSSAGDSHETSRRMSPSGSEVKEPELNGAKSTLDFTKIKIVFEKARRDEASVVNDNDTQQTKEFADGLSLHQKITVLVSKDKKVETRTFEVTGLSESEVKLKDCSWFGRKDVITNEFAQYLQNVRNCIAVKAKSETGYAEGEESEFTEVNAPLP